MKKIYNIIIMSILLCNVVKIAAYPWPITGMNTQHWICGTFGECRGDGTRDHFHRGIDIDNGTTKTAVYPVINAKAIVVSGDVVILEGIDVYEYYTYDHLSTISIQQGDTVYAVEADSNRIGYFNENSNSTHLHFGDGYEYGYGFFNPLFYIEPFDDNTDPTVDYVKVVKNLNSSNTSYTELTSLQEGDQVDIIVRAHDAISTYGGDNNGIFEIQVEIIGPEPSESVVMQFSGFVFDDYLFDNNPNVNYVYAPESQGTPSGIFIYVPTNGYYSDDCWDTNGFLEGEYTIKIYLWDHDTEYGDPADKIDDTKSIWLDASPEQENYSKRRQ